MQKNQVFSSGEVSDVERMIRRYLRRNGISAAAAYSDQPEMHLDGGWAAHDLIDSGGSVLSGTDTKINGGSA